MEMSLVSLLSVVFKCLLLASLANISSAEAVSLREWPDQLNSSLTTAEWGFGAALEAALTRQAWLWSLLGTVVVGLSGVFPLLVIPIGDNADLNKGESANTLRLLLSFAVGGLLGDVFIHQLPEAWTSNNNGSEINKITTGLWVLAGVLVFTVLEMALHDENDEKTKRSDENSNPAIHDEESEISENKGKVKVSGYLNLLNNSMDNFMHGLAVGGSFMISFKMGLVTTIALLIHEVPHEIGDFAILLRSGFSRWEAARAQMMTASVGLLGALVANLSSASNLEENNLWVVPFTAGGFLHIALVSLLPELVAEEDKKESIKQIFSLFGGIAVIFLLTNAL
ncbi:zinc transporter ZIP13 homolog [Neocloeon triangulifer]|uniref:zinc transporter ZIP13 homolog n=1 Tax=Neocloeon triangulifer TaxID=2078957 RepID=UPI00286F8BF0|nr:zinc transporter ZIP13 homolog [Neocloeon triangulifer]